LPLTANAPGGLPVQQLSAVVGMPAMQGTLLEICCLYKNVVVIVIFEYFTEYFIAQFELFALLIMAITTTMTTSVTACSFVSLVSFS